MDYAGACKTLKLGRLKYTPRHELNDVFEYTFSDDLNIDGKKLLKTAQKTVQEYITGKINIDFTPTQLQQAHFQKLQKIREAIQKGKTKFTPITPSFQEEQQILQIIIALTQDCKKLFDTTLSRNIICCFSETNENAALWAHYADKNTGVVLGFEPLEETDSPLLTAKPVEYVQDISFPLTEQDLLESFGQLKGINQSKIIEKPIFTKKIDWQYEKEWRVSIWQRPNEVYTAQFYPFSPIELKEIYFGCHILSENKDCLLNIIKVQYPWVRCFETKPSTKSFKYLFTEI